IGHDRRHTIAQDDFLTIARNHTIHTAKDRTEEVGNHRLDKTAANHLIDVGGHVEHTVQGHHQLTAGQSIERKTLRYDLQASDKVVLKGPGGTITIDSGGITLEGIAIKLKGPMSQSGGAGNQLSIKGVAEQGRALNTLCAMRSDGTCPLEPCPCGRSGTAR
ncbi:type VI secretion system tip protein VgrG, partial [Achromobacter sp. NPDC058515]